MIPSGLVITPSLVPELETATKRPSSGLHTTPDHVLLAALARVVQLDTALLAVARDVRARLDNVCKLTVYAVPAVVCTVFPYVLIYPVTTTLAAVTAFVTRTPPETSNATEAVEVPMATLPAELNSDVPDVTHLADANGTPFCVIDPVKFTLPVVNPELTRAVPARSSVNCGAVVLIPTFPAV